MAIVDIGRYFRIYIGRKYVNDVQYKEWSLFARTFKWEVENPISVETLLEFIITKLYI